MDSWYEEYRSFIAEKAKEYDERIAEKFNQLAEVAAMAEDIKLVEKELAEKKKLHEERSANLMKFFDKEKCRKRKANTEDLPVKKRKRDENASEKVDKTDKKPRQKRSTNAKKCQQNICNDSSTGKKPAQNEMKVLDTTLTVGPSNDIYDSTTNKENDRFVYLRTTRDMKKKLVRDLYKYCGNQGQANIVDNLTKDILDVVESTLEKNTNMFSLGLVLSFTGERREEGDRRPYYIPYSRVYTRSEFETILYNEFERSVMSNNINDFLNDDIYLRVDYVLDDDPKNVGGRFRGIVNRFGFDSNQLLSIKSTTNDCLFEALYIGRKYAKSDTDDNENKRRTLRRKVRMFVDDVNNGNARKIRVLKEKVVKLKEATETNTPGPYSAQDIGGKFQEYLEQKYPKEYQIQFFDENHTLKPFIKFGYIGAPKIITIFLHEEHFAVIMDMKKFLQLEKRTHSLDGEDPVAHFFDWMTTLPNERIVVVAHNGGRYDYQLFYNHMVNTNWEALDVTRNGPKFYKIDFKVKGRKKPIRFIDSVNFIPMSLSNLPKTFNLDVDDKGHFPYMANSMTDYTLDELPPIESFGYASKPPQAQLDLKKWYDENKQTKWNLKKELDHYCKNDVRILAHACQKFIVEWQKKNNFNPFVLSTTIASACMTTFRMNYLKPQTVAITPTHGYGAKKNASEMGAKLMLYIAEIFGFGGKDSPFWHVSTRRGEKKIGKYHVDGFCHDEISGIDYIIEFDGAFWH
uniref:DNA-directed DNA polymerase n=1 Tax=Panagrolaimus sp. JU765 TaxID=591449 RepID=A0AC34QCH9_9BILA